MSRTPNQTAAIEGMAKYLCVDAGAGSGKTSVLIDRIVRLIDQRLASLDDVVAITFTEAAAAEMKERLRAAFRERAPVDDPDEMSRWRDMERRIESARVSTIHAFCAGLLRENALRIGLDPDFTVVAEAESDLLRGEVVTDTVHALLEASDEAAVRAATELGTRPLINEMEAMLKRRRLLDRIGRAHPVQDPEALCAHWRQVADEADRRNLVALARSPRLRLLRDGLADLAGHCDAPGDAREVGRAEMVAALDGILGCGDADTIRQHFGRIADVGFRGARKKNWDDEDALDAVKALEEETRKLAKDALPPEIDEETERRAARLTVDVHATYRNVLDAFQSAKAERACLDFDDLIRAALETLRGNDEVRARTARSIKFLLIDEFQDTDSSQLEMARLLAGHPEGPALFIVGDAKQSIYDFRDAEVEVFQQEKADADTVIPLGRNFRTVPEVMGFINETFARSDLLEAVEPEYVRLQTHRASAGPRRVEFLVPEPEEGLNRDDYREREADLIAWRIESMCGGAEPASVIDKGSAEPRPAAFGDVALLFRSTNKIYLYEEGLRRRSIPYNVVAGAGFYERQEIIDLRNLLTVLVDPWDEAALLGFLRGPMAGLSDESLLEWCAGRGAAAAFRSSAVPGLNGDSNRLFGSHVLPQWTTTPDQINAYCPHLTLEAARELVADLRAHSEMPLPAFLRYVLDRTGYEALALSQFLGVQKASNVRKLVDLAEGFSRVRPPRLAAFVHYLDAVTLEAIREGEATLAPEGSGAVTLMSIHKAKGLEFPIVVIPDASRDLHGPDTRPLALHRELGVAARVTNSDGESVRPAVYDAIRREHKHKGRAEHARILYVAMTRARDWLFIGGDPAPGTGSWMKTFDDVYGLLEREDGDVVEGDGWGAVVRRTAERGKRAERPALEAAAPCVEDLVARAGPIVPSAEGRKSFSVSELLDAMTATRDAEDLDTAPADQSRDPLLRGSLVHRMLEIWDLDGDPPIDPFLRRECPAIRAWDALGPYLRDVADRFTASPLGRRMKADPDLRREAPFLLRLGDAIVSGTIDALLGDGTIIDYKTGRFAPERHARYETQLRLYAVAVRRLLDKRPPAALLYYTDTADEHEVDLADPLLDEVAALAQAAIAALRRNAATAAAG